MNWKQRYQQAHEYNFKNKYPEAYADGHYFNPTYPKVNTANGLTLAISNFVNWNGFRATRISTTGRQLGGKWIYGTTRKGTADLSLTINGKAVMIEIKVGSDKPSKFQLEEQAKERAAGGIYEFIHTFEQFLELYDRLIK